MKHTNNSGLIAGLVALALVGGFFWGKGSQPEPVRIYLPQEPYYVFAPLNMATELSPVIVSTWCTPSCGGRVTPLFETNGNKFNPRGVKVLEGTCENIYIPAEIQSVTYQRTGSNGRVISGGAVGGAVITDVCGASLRLMSDPIDGITR